MEMDMARELRDSLKLTSEPRRNELDQDDARLSQMGNHKRKRPMRGLRTKAKKRGSYYD